MLRIRRLEAATSPWIGLVRVTAQVFHRQMAPHAPGGDALAVEPLLEPIGRREHRFPGSTRPCGT